MALKPNLSLEQSRLRVRNSQVVVDQQRTFLTAAVTAGASTLTVENIDGFSIGEYLVIGRIGDESSEIVRIHTGTAPTGTTITLNAAIVRSHTIDTVVQRTPFNQAEFSRATASGGAKSVLATSDLDVDQEFTVYDDTANSTGFAYIRFKNSATSTYSDYSDEQAYAALAYNSVGKMIDDVFAHANETGQSFLKRTAVLGFIQRFYDKLEEARTRFKHEESSSDTTNTTTKGGVVYALPTDMKYDDDRSIIAIHIAGEEPLEWLSQREYIDKIAGLGISTLNGAVSSGAVTIDLSDATHFPTSGTGYIDGDEFTWTGKTGNQLTGVSGVLDHDDGEIAVDGQTIDAPTHYSILNGILTIHPGPDGDYDNRPLVIDYWTFLTRPDSENDLIPIRYLSSCYDYCLMCVEDLKPRGKGSPEKYEKRYERSMIQAIRNDRELQGGAFRMKE